MTHYGFGSSLLHIFEFSFSSDNLWKIGTSIEPTSGGKVPWSLCGPSTSPVDLAHCQKHQELAPSWQWTCFGNSNNISQCSPHVLENMICALLSSPILCEEYSTLVYPIQLVHSVTILAAKPRSSSGFRVNRIPGFLQFGQSTSDKSSFIWITWITMYWS